MFSRSDGPTALRADLVRALSLSSQQCELAAAEGTREPAVAALAGVWNGRKGFVALVVYRIHSQNVERYVFADPIDSERGLDQAVDEGLAFAETFGFGMDPPEFLSIPADQQEQRLRVWNKLRKPRPGIASPLASRIPTTVQEFTGDIDPTDIPTPTPAPAAAAQVRAAVLAPPIASAPPAGEPVSAPVAELAVPVQPGEAAPAAEAQAGRAVIGRIGLVRRGVEDLRPDPLVRLLSYL